MSRWRKLPLDSDKRDFRHAILPAALHPMLASLVRVRGTRGVSVMLGANEWTVEKLTSKVGCSRPARDRVVAALVALSAGHERLGDAVQEDVA